jgi:hypothetical protein
MRSLSPACARVSKSGRITTAGVPERCGQA